MKMKDFKELPKREKISPDAVCYDYEETRRYWRRIKQSKKPRYKNKRTASIKQFLIC